MTTVTHATKTKRSDKAHRRPVGPMAKQAAPINTRALKKLMSVISPENKSETRLPQDLGELNFYTWQEIKKYSIGKWNNILYKA